MKYLLILLLLASSCSPAHRLSMLIKRHPELAKSDTVFRQDTIVTNEIQADSTFIFQHVIDTFNLVKDKLSVQIIRRHDTLLVNGIVRADTIIRIVPIKVTTIQPAQPISWFKCILMWVGALCLTSFAIIVGLLLLTKSKPSITINDVHES